MFFFFIAQTLMLNNRVQNVNGLQSMLRKAGEYLSTLPQETPYSEFEHKFQEIGFERGWGDTAGRVSEMFHMLLDLLEAPDACTLETFLGKIPMVFNVVILSPHGYFAQENVLGYPDTGGQVCRYKMNGYQVYLVYYMLIVLIWYSFLSFFFLV